MSKPKNNVNDLLATIKRTPTSVPDVIPELIAASERPVAAPVKRVERPAAKTDRKNRVGKAVQFWMHDEESGLVRELSAWVAGQGIRPTDSMIIRAALRFAKTGSAFLEAYKDAGQLDGRYKR
jgi:hypothetical protein